MGKEQASVGLLGLSRRDVFIFSFADSHAFLRKIALELIVPRIQNHPLLNWSLLSPMQVLTLIIFILAGPVAQADLLYRGSLAYPGSVLPSDRYPEEVAIYQPGQLTLEEPYDLILHLHGYRMLREELGGRLEDFDDVLHEFDFDSLLRAAHRPAVLVVPSSLGNCDTYRSHLSTGLRIRAFLSALTQKIGRAPRRLILIGHSGSYSMIARISETQLFYSIPEIYLLDASYGEEASFARYAKNPAHRLVSVFRTGTDTESGSYKIWRRLFPKIPQRGAYARFRRNLLPAQASAQQIPRQGPHFIATDGGHWKLVSEYWSTLIAK